MAVTYVGSVLIILWFIHAGEWISFWRALFTISSRSDFAPRSAPSLWIYRVTTSSGKLNDVARRVNFSAGIFLLGIGKKKDAVVFICRLQESHRWPDRFHGATLEHFGQLIAIDRTVQGCEIEIGNCIFYAISGTIAVTYAMADIFCRATRWIITTLAYILRPRL